MNRILTALQPSGILHIGNLFGAIEPMVGLQSDENENLLFAVDYHAITVPQKPAELRRNILFATATYLAVGIDPTKTILFQQSRVSEHTELAWILNCIAHMGELERMTQFKDKSQGNDLSVSVGLFDYPVLMASDILLYDTNVVPVGADQKQHVELARDLAERFNNRFGETFVVPTPQIRKEGARIMGLDDPEKKMSKSATSEKNYISIMDDEATVLKKIKSAVTDSQSTIMYDEKRKGLANLLTIYSLVTNTHVNQIASEYEGKGYGDFKVGLAEAISDYLTPLQEKIKGYLANEDELINILDQGAQRAKAIASKKMEVVRQKIGVQL
ncbi:tryptophan--tRNA ligase [Candidatus Uhrbacteria bacterium CG10_big_fil_rev_8_21_14_0_10_48_16]|uniref:Tryptophan--tRNA ligase n=1 Tax=Candidatus Uhrbacteria bacterium CG10_big_fil_rev_8_21_14_0_10_48_16 TaxID=1975038 RepID=A0A2M8LHL5_9BACT|nr:MAG: tryptophan--tRNA ligase [Candidatus Uhrbacteria bacterium CG10_big_fil_rev_8_21_14_0_10_48_16]